MITTRPEIVGSFGAVTSSHPLASSVGMSILERGGNAADAAVATGFMLQIVEPHLNGPGGEAPILVWSDRTRRVDVISGQGVAGQAASVEALQDLGLDIMPGTGLLPTVVPGAFGAWMTLLREHGTKTPREVLEPTIHYLTTGHPLQARVSRALGTVEKLFSEEWPSSHATWMPRGAVPAPGSRYVNPVLGATYSRIVEEAEAAGPSRDRQIQGALDAWYRGFVAEAVGRFSAETEAMDTSGRRHRGLLTADDFAGWDAEIEEPLSYDYHGHTVFKTGPWGQGPVFLQQLALLDTCDLQAMGAGSADWVHTIVEMSKLAFADREAWYGDPRFTDVPIGDLLSVEYNAQRSRLIGAEASLALRPGAPGGREPRLPVYPDTTGAGEFAAGTGEPTVASDGDTRGDTCHLDVVDRDGMMIAATPSGGWFQSSPTIPELGFCLSTRGQMFWVEQGLPNSLRPGARPRTTLTPSMVLRDGEPWLAFGTPGGDAQDQWTLHFFLNLVHGDGNLQQAIEVPGFHSTHVPSSFYPRDAHPGQLLVEDRMPEDVRTELARRGHRLIVGDAWSEGYMTAAAREDGWIKAAASPRGQAYAVGR